MSGWRCEGTSLRQEDSPCKLRAQVLAGRKAAQGRETGRTDSNKQKERKGVTDKVTDKPTLGRRRRKQQ